MSDHQMQKRSSERLSRKRKEREIIAAEQQRKKNACHRPRPGDSSAFRNDCGILPSE